MRLLLIAVVALAACAPQPESTVEERAEQVASATLVTLQPGVDRAPVATCVRDHAKFDELLTLSTDDARTPSIEAVALVQDMLTREEVQTCIAANNVVLVE